MMNTEISCCGIKFSSQSKLNYHYKNVHQNELNINIEDEIGK